MTDYFFLAAGFLAGALVAAGFLAAAFAAGFAAAFAIVIPPRLMAEKNESGDLLANKWRFGMAPGCAPKNFELSAA